MADPSKPVRADEVHALARRMEARARRTRDRDLARVGVLLRILLAIMTDDGAGAASDPCQDAGRLH